MAETVTGTTVGDVKYVVVYFDVNTNNLYDANGQLYGNNTLATFLDNEFTLELHYVQDISTSSNPEEWAVWDGLKDLTVSSTLAFDDNYLHAVKGTVVADTAAGSPSVSVDVTDEINKDTLSRYGVLLVNPFGDEEDQLMIPYSSFQQVSGTTFSFIVDDAQGLEASVTKDSPVRVSDPLYMFINANDIYEANIPNRYEEGVFKFPVNVMSRKLLNALDYSGSTGVSGTMEHKIYANKTNVVGLKNKSFTPPMPLDRNQDIDEVASLREFVGIKTTIGGDTVYPRDASHDRTNDGTDYYAWMNTENDTVAFYTKTTNVTVGTLLYDELYFTQLDETVSALVYEVNPYLFCGWNSGILKYWTKGNDVKENDYFYNISGGTATVGTASASPVYEAEPVLFRTFAFPFIVRNLVDYGVSLTIPTEDIDWTKEYIISIIRNNMEEVTGKASQGAYGVVLIGTNIDVADGVISVKDASTSDKGVIQIATSEEVTTGTDTSKAVVPSTLKTELDKKQDNLSNGNVTTLNTTSGAKIDVNVGDGLAVGIAGSTNANKLITDNATVEEILTDSRKVIVEGATESTSINNITDRVVEPHDLKGALSVGQAVDVSCEPETGVYDGIGTSTVTYAEGRTFLDGFEWAVSITNGSNAYIGWYHSRFPKALDDFRYLMIVDVKNKSTSQSNAMIKMNAGSYTTLTPGQSKHFVQIATPDSYDSIGWLIASQGSGTFNFTLEITNWRQYEVTNLTDEAIAYLAQLENPDDFFRSTSAYSIRDKYLIKQDMVCPFIPTIEMSNSDLTVATGLSYKMTYKSDTATTHTITADTIPELAYGWDTHLQLFVDNNTTVNFQNPLILQDPLTPNAGHNMTIKWRNGQALAYVDDIDVGYIVTVTAGTENGSLYYGLTNDVGEYITFANTIDGIPVVVDGATVRRSVNILGNGSGNTTINTNGSGVLIVKTIRDVSTNFAVHFGNIYNCNFTNVICAPINAGAYSTCIYRKDQTISNSTITGCTAGNYGVVEIEQGGSIVGCTITNNINDVTVYSRSASTTTIKDSFIDNSGASHYIFVGRTNNLLLSGNTINNGYISNADGAICTFDGTNVINAQITGTGNIKFASNAVITSDIPSGSTLGTGIINLSGNTNYLTNDLGTITIDGLTITNGLYFGIYIQNENVANLTNCNITGNTVGDAFVHINSTANISGGTYGIVELDLGAILNLSGRVNVRKNITGRGVVNLADNTIIDCTGNTNTSVILMGAGSIGDEGAVVVGSGCKVVTSGGSTVSITGGTYYSINNAQNAPTTAQAPYVYGYATVKDSGVYVPVELQNGVVTQVDALVLSRMSCHDARIALMDDCATRHIKYYVKPNDLTKKLDGTASKLDGTDGDVMTEFPKSHFLYTENGTVATSGGNDTKDVVLMSRSAFTYNNVDSDWHKSFYISPDGNTVRNQFMGYYPSYVDEDNKMRSISGVYPRVNLRLGSTYYSGTTKVTNTNNPSYLKYAGNNGGTNCNRLHYEWLYHLLITKELTIDTQSISLGFCYMSGTAWSTAYPRLTGYSNQVDFYGGQTFANDNDKDIEAMWSGCSITSNSLVWGTSPDKLQFTTSGNTRTVTAFGWRNGTSPNFSYVYTKFEDGMPQIGDTCYSDASCTVEYGTITAVNTGTASSNRVTSCKYFIENPWSNLWQNQAGYVPIVTTGGVRTTAGFYRTTAINSYETILTFDKNTTDSTAQNANVEYVEHPWATANNYVITWNPVTFHALTTGAYNSSKIKDYLYIVNAVDVPRCGFVGGNAPHATFGGLGFESVTIAVGFSDPNCVGRLSA